MALGCYGVLNGTVLDCRRGVGGSRHYQVHIRAGGDDHRAAVNFRSKGEPSDLLFAVAEDFVHPVTRIVRRLPAGFTRLGPGPRTGALDYVRGRLFGIEDLRRQPVGTPGRRNDLREVLDRLVKEAMQLEGATIHVFGEPWGPEPGQDRYFGFGPSRGMHEIHMNQGNADKFQDNDGVWQDGGVLFRYPTRSGKRRAERWSAVFLAFGSQAWRTDDRTGRRL
ncbi:MAG: YukJ family protein [Planctomycetes bacterium]|nr:YukJ family protein [Planctomycetota bacterium]